MFPLDTVKPDDVVVRLLGEAVKMKLAVTAITQDRIICGSWQFCRETGAEIDEELGWDRNGTGSRIIEIIRR